MTFIKVMGFSVVLLAFYAVYAQLLPQVEPDRSAPVEASTDGLDMAGMIALGEMLFHGKGTCTLCHNDLGRAPDLLQTDLAASFPERLADPRYSGVSAGKTGAKAVEGYILESMRAPSAYVVAGFGKKGTDDTVSPMPVVDAAPIGLSSVEMNALAAFLQDRAGFDPTVPLPSADDTPVAQTPDAGAGPAPLLTSGQDIVDEYGCAACHDLNGSGADIGPSLYGIGKRMDRAQLIEAVIDPNATIAPGFEPGFMPSDFGDRMRGAELLTLAQFLLELPDTAPALPDPSALPVATTVTEVIDNYGCAGCHDLEGSGAEVGPRLNGLGARLSPDGIRTAILDPNASIAEGFEAGLMPDDFAQQMADSEIDLIVDYLVNLPE